ncbi:TBC-domain-containing protein [Linnemannia elongata AG-77]|uniref:TBC-domain-containing protein n=1 Tax=Linnemannia elongata AG-77 TaxID=1314771 RepID=A0A197K318_9FUNG|nr:TBC-domain-containing protein [Linnemannia elongata AG-77]
MAMATPAPLGRNRNNEFVADAAGPSSPSQHQPQHQLPYHQPVPARRILKTSKSVDGLRRARSHTADPTSQSLRRDFEGLYMNSPSLTQTQLDAYGGNNSSDNYNSNNNGHYQPQGLTPSRSLHRNGGNQNGNVFDPRGESRSRNHSQNQQQQDQQGLAPSQPGSTQSPYQTLHVQASQIASRSTPKLTLFTQPVSQSHYTNESKETRSFNGLPGQLDPKPKPKSSRLKPIVAVEKADDEHVERDQYGFKKESQWLSQHDFVIFETYYIPIMERRRQKWAIFMNDSAGELPPRSAKLKRYIRKGIPPALRGEAWFHYSGAEDKCKANPGLFKRLVAQAKAKGAANEHAEVIERDLHRTFPENINFKSQITKQQDGGTSLSTENVAAIQSLRRVLLAFSLHCPTIGYCQSLNYIAGMLLLFMNEEQSFWTLSVIIQNFLPEGMYDVTMEGSNIDQAVLMTLIMERLPSIWAKFSGGATSVEMDEGPGLPTVTLVTSHWFLTLFINILPVESILRVWDCFFYEGRKILFRVALTILRMHESEISKIDDPLEVFQVVQNIPKRLIDCHKLMEACFKRMGSFDLTTKDIDRRYDTFRAKRKSARAAAQASRTGAHRDPKK